MQSDRNSTTEKSGHCSAAEIEAIRLALRHKEALEHLGTIQDAITLKQGLSVGAVWTVYQVARRLGIEKALGTTRDGKLALWQVIARVIDQGSRLSAVRLAMSHAACDVLGVGPFDEDALYDNLDWLAHRQAAVEDQLFAQHTKTTSVSLFLYDVTSSYLEGTHTNWPRLATIAMAKEGSCKLSSASSVTRTGIRSPSKCFPAIPTIRTPWRHRLRSSRNGLASKQSPSLATGV